MNNRATPRTHRATTVAITRLKAERLARGLSQQELGEVLGCCGQAISKLERGLRPSPRKALAQRMALWSGGKIHKGNFDEPAPPPKRRGRQ